MSAEQVEDLFAEFARITETDGETVRDFFGLTGFQQSLVMDNLRGMDWTRSPDRLAQALAVAEAIGTFAGAMSGLAGAGSAIAALRSL